MSAEDLSKLSDWTDQDLLTREEAAKRLDRAIAELEAKAASASGDARDDIEHRLDLLRQSLDSTRRA